MANARRELGETNQLEFPRVSRSTFSKRRTPTRPMATRSPTGRSLGRRGDLFAQTSDSRFPWAVEYADPRLRGWVRRSIPVRSTLISYLALFLAFAGKSSGFADGEGKFDYYRVRASRFLVTRFSDR